MSWETMITTRTGKKLTVRPPRWEDLDQLLKFINKLIKEDTYIIMVGKPMTKKEEAEYLTGLLKKIRQKKAVALLVFDGDKLVANSQITKSERRLSHIGNFGITVAKGYRDEGIGSQLTKLVIKQAKEKLGVKIIELSAFSNNNRARYLYQKLGFKEFGRLPKSITHRGKVVDRIYMYQRL